MSDITGRQWLTEQEAMTPHYEAEERLQMSVHTYDPDTRARTYNEGFDEGWGQAHEDLVTALSVLENYGDHHEWCPRTPCDCGFERELHELRGLRDQVKEPNRAAEREPLLAALRALRALVAFGDRINYDDTEMPPGHGDWRRFNDALAEARALIEKYGGGG
jgi:hypothetical protein